MKERQQAPGVSRWSSPQAEAEFRRRSDALAAALAAERSFEMPAPVDVPTRLGPTRVDRWDGEGEPVVFLHGTTGTSLAWVEYAQHRRGRSAYAVDTIGDVGHSRQEVAVTGPRDLADWLADVLDGLRLERAHLAGVSYGGFLALNLAAHHPARVRTLTLFEPAGIERVRMARFMAWGTASMVAAFLPTPLRARAARRLRMPVLDDPRIIRVVAYGQRHHRARLLRPDPLTDAQLAGIAQPVLAVLGERSEVFPAAAVAARLEGHLPDVTVRTVADAGHGLVVSDVDRLAGWLADFLADHDPA